MSNIKNIKCENLDDMQLYKIIKIDHKIIPYTLHIYIWNNIYEIILGCYLMGGAGWDAKGS